jgi:choloylglycine hydrolase
VTNLRNYLGISPFNAEPEKPAGVSLLPLGQGSGMHGLPGDFTPPSRFVRAVAFTQTAEPIENAEEGVKVAFHLLNLFDIPKGVVRGKEGTEAQADHTQWTSAADMTRRRFYIRTYADSQIRMVDLARCNLDAKDLLTVKLDEEEPIADLTPAAK